eukprot:TRINITY_DN6434_c0_g1_i1.p1 TRINITY_DN6434_c0_g1~~TRINITY_DN6434_c0_g1_i1.p1  ORF type:complete len:651 (-),score=33.48 TRINITY_DN6434_c0_g1_i1:10-1962(-)
MANSVDKLEDRIVLTYLKKRGYRNAEAALKAEAQVLPLDQYLRFTERELELAGNVGNFILMHSSAEKPESYKQSYIAFKEWIHSSLDIYQQEMVGVLYPVFVHFYLDLIEKGFSSLAADFLTSQRREHEAIFGDEIRRLQGVTTPDNMRDNELVRTFRGHKYVVSMSRFSCDLMVSFLREKNYMLLLRTINQYVTVRLSFAGPVVKPSEEYKGITGETESKVADINHKVVHWGFFEDQLPKPKDESELPEDEEDKDVQKGKKRNSRVRKKVKRTDKDKEPELPKSTLPVPKMTEQAELDYLKDLGNRVTLSSSVLPSICFYTVFHSHGSLNTLDVSPDGSLVAGGFADSSVRLWDMMKPKGGEIVEDHASSTSVPPKPRKADYTTLLGHSGPVYGVAFSPDPKRQFCLTCSEDTTVRLWSIETKSNVVVYKGHNYPIWDVAFSPFGYYFATASHDRTARLFSTDKIFPVRIFAGHLSDVNCVDFHPNCNYVATGSTDKTVRLWDVQSGTPVRLFTGHLGGVNTLAVSPDGKTVASAGDDNKVILWDLGTSKRLATFSGHKSSVWSLSFSQEGSVLASGSADNSVCLWDCARATDSAGDGATDGEEARPKADQSGLIQRYPTRQTGVYKVRFTRRNLLLAAGAFASEDDTY